MTFDVTSYGEIGLRLSPADDSALSRANTLAVNVIGTEFNVLSNLASLGWQTALLSAVPDVPMGDKATSSVRLNGVDDRLVYSLTGDYRIGVYFVDYGAGPKPIEVFFDRKGTAFTSFIPAENDIAALLDTKVLHLSGLSLALSDTVVDTSTKLLSAATAAGVMVSFDLNHRRKLWSADTALKLSTPFLEQADILIAPNADVNELFDRSGDALTNLDFLANRTNAKIVIVTDGSGGSVALVHGATLTQSARPVTIIDRLGAGDGFAAGVLHAVSSGRPEMVLSYGAHMAALALSHKGEQVRIRPNVFEAIVRGEAGELQR